MLKVSETTVVTFHVFDDGLSANICPLESFFGGYQRKQPTALKE